MSFANWDEMIFICIELAEYDYEKAITRKTREPTPPNDLTDLTLTMPIPTPTILPLKIA